MTKQELSALVSILNRAAISSAEALWLRELMQREEDEIALRAAVVPAPVHAPAGGAPPVVDPEKIAEAIGDAEL